MNRLILSLAAFASVAAALPSVASAQDVGARQTNQQARIQQGVRSGELTGRETRHLERGEARLAYRKDMMRARDGGRLTGHDRVALNRQENRLSRHIFRAKHNGRVE
jgi:Ni/Co efflux regulator RcnB